MLVFRDCVELPIAKTRGQTYRKSLLVKADPNYKAVPCCSEEKRGYIQLREELLRIFRFGFWCNLSEVQASPAFFL